MKAIKYIPLIAASALLVACKGDGFLSNESPSAMDASSVFYDKTDDGKNNVSVTLVGVAAAVPAANIGNKFFAADSPLKPMSLHFCCIILSTAKSSM